MAVEKYLKVLLKENADFIHLEPVDENGDGIEFYLQKECLIKLSKLELSQQHGAGRRRGQLFKV